MYALGFEMCIRFKIFVLKHEQGRA